MGHFEDVIKRSGLEKKSITGRVLAGFCDYLAAGLEQVARSHGGRIRALESRLAVVEQKGNVGIVYRGTWGHGGNCTYRLGDMVTHHGSLWHCNENGATSPPSYDNPDWSLAARKGRDARGDR